MLSESNALSKILSKFCFANEDIMRQYVNSQFNNCLDREKFLDVSQSNPNHLWSSCGIAYDITKSNKANNKSSVGVHIPKDVLRKKLDILLYSTSQNIKNLIFKQSQEAQGYSNGPPAGIGSNGECYWSDSTFAQNLTKQVVVLNSYLRRQQSRVMLNQIIDTCLESLLMIKRVLSDVSLKENIFIIDSTK